jgi:hypothetical protein
MNQLKRMLNKAVGRTAGTAPADEDHRVAETGSAIENFDEQEAVAGVDTAIAEVVDAITTNRQMIVATLQARDIKRTNDPRPDDTALGVLLGSRRRILDQLHSNRNNSRGKTAGETQLETMNDSLANRLRELTAEFNQGSISARLFTVQMHSEVANYLESVEKILKPITINVS